MKKIQTSLVNKNANVQVIELNSYFIAKTVRMQAKLQRVIEDLNIYKDNCDENGKSLGVDSEGKDITRTAYERTTLEPWQVETIAKDISGYFEELTKALEEA